MLTGIREQLEAASRAAATLRGRVVADTAALAPDAPGVEGLRNFTVAADRDLAEATRMAGSPWHSAQGNPNLLREAAIGAIGVAAAAAAGALVSLWLPLTLPLQALITFAAMIAAGLPPLVALNRRRGRDRRPGGRPGPDDGRPTAELIGESRDAVAAAMLALLARRPAPAGLPQRARVQWEARNGRLPMLLCRADVDFAAAQRFLARLPETEARDDRDAVG
ncbi:MAG TPA: hypothetical protein VL738_16875 [Dactylosporangium sp.]|nr:hypothetical protein [Dactylosporangium sp.]